LAGVADRAQTGPTVKRQGEVLGLEELVVLFLAFLMVLLCLPCPELLALVVAVVHTQLAETNTLALV
jgi:hypothetical protein